MDGLAGLALAAAGGCVKIHAVFFCARDVLRRALRVCEEAIATELAHAAMQPAHAVRRAVTNGFVRGIQADNGERGRIEVRTDG